MKKIGFIGMYDKTDLILYIAKILTTLNKRVLIIDATSHQKARYIVPAMSPTIKYIKNYLGLPQGQEMDYDIALIDTDHPISFRNFALEAAQKNYFITSFDVYSLKRGLEIFRELHGVANLTKVLFSKEMIKEEDDYLNFLSSGYKIVWNEYRIYFPIENGDLNVLYENQRLSKIKFKKLSIPYKDGLVYLAEEILGDVSEANIRKAVKVIEKNG